jgi:hypothetical protein
MRASFAFEGSGFKMRLRLAKMAVQTISFFRPRRIEHFVGTLENVPGLSLQTATDWRSFLSWLSVSDWQHSIADAG